MHTQRIGYYYLQCWILQNLNLRLSSFDPVGYHKFFNTINLFSTKSALKSI